MSRPQLREKMEDICWRCLTQSQKRQLLHNNQQVLLLPKCLQIYFAKHDSNFREVFRILSTILATCLKRATGHSRPLFLTPSITLLHAILWGCIEFASRLFYLRPQEKLWCFISALTNRSASSLIPLANHFQKLKSFHFISETASLPTPRQMAHLFLLRARSNQFRE